MKTGFALLLLLPLSGFAQELPPYPEWGPSLVRFEACTANGHVAEVQYKISNFSSSDMMLPSLEYAWASKEETTAAAQKVFSANVPPFIALSLDEDVEQDDYLVRLALTETTIYGELPDGRVGDWPVTLDVKNMLQTKMEVMREMKYTALTVFFGKPGSFVKVDRTRPCGR